MLRKHSYFNIGRHVTGDSSEERVAEGVVKVSGGLLGVLSWLSEYSVPLPMRVMQPGNTTFPDGRQATAVVCEVRVQVVLAGKEARAATYSRACRHQLR